MTTRSAGDALQAAVITVSDRSAGGFRVDTAGPVAVAMMQDAGYACTNARIIPDGVDTVSEAIREASRAGARLIVTTGGTGIGPRDLTPEGTRAVLDRTVDGVAEQLRRAVVDRVPTAALSRGVAGVVGDCFVVNLPGSPRAVAEGMRFILRIAPHAVSQLDGGDH